MEEEKQNNILENLEQGYPLNTGVIIPEILPESDYVAGGISGIEYRVVLPTGNWTSYRSRDEQQQGVYFDSKSCVTFSALNSIEMQINRMIAFGELPENVLQELRELGFFDDDGKFNASDRFTAKMSGTTRFGNSLNAVWDSIRKDGLLPERDLPFPSTQREPKFLWEDFFATIPQELIDKAKKILKFFDFSHEWVIAGVGQMSEGERQVIKEHLLQAPLQVAAAVCRGWNKGDETAVPNCGLITTQHATVIGAVEDGTNLFINVDHYQPFVKKLAQDYPLPWIKKGLVIFKKDSPTPIPTEKKLTYKFDFRRDGQIMLGQRSVVVKVLQTALFLLGFLKENQITGFYWYGTKDAVYRWQKQYGVGSPQEIEAQQGRYFGPKGMQKMNEIFGNS